MPLLRMGFPANEAYELELPQTKNNIANSLNEKHYLWWRI